MKLRICSAKDWSHKVVYWYDKSLRVWTIQVKDCDDNQIGEAHYEANRFHAMALVHQLATKNEVAA